MKTLLVLALLATSALASDPIIVIGGKAYRDATVSAEPGMVVKITHRDGTARLRAWEVDAAWQRKLGFVPSAVEAERLRIVADARMRAESARREAEIRRIAEEKRIAEKGRADAAQAEADAKEAREWKVKERQRRERAAAETEQDRRDFEAWRESQRSAPGASDAILREWARRRFLDGK